MLGLAPTVGNRPDGLLGDTPVPEMAGSVAGDKEMDGTVGVVVDDTATTSVADPENDFAPLADAVAVICTCSPSAALALTGTTACSSSAWPRDRLPTSQVVPCATGQTVNRGVPT